MMVKDNIKYKCLLEYEYSEIHMISFSIKEKKRQTPDHHQYVPAVETEHDGRELEKNIKEWVPTHSRGRYQHQPPWGQ